MCERSRAQRRPMIPRCQRSSGADSIAKALFLRGLRSDDRDVRVRLKMRKCRDALTEDGGAVDPGDGETATLDPGRVTRTSLHRTDANGERPSQRCTASEQWQRGVSASPSGVPRMMGHKKYISRSSIRRNGDVERGTAVRLSPRMRHVHQTAGIERYGGPSDAIVRLARSLIQ